jgi:hypothetical protein
VRERWASEEKEGFHDLTIVTSTASDVALLYLVVVVVGQLTCVFRYAVTLDYCASGRTLVIHVHSLRKALPTVVWYKRYRGSTQSVDQRSPKLAG